MARTELPATAPARARVGLPIVPDGSRRHPHLLRLPPAADGSEPACNNGCEPCLTRAVDDVPDAVFGQHVVLRDREPTLRGDLAQVIFDLRRRGAASVALLTNGRMLVYARVARVLVDAGVDRFVVKLFGLDAGAHDAHTRVPGSFEQALRGIATVRELGGQALVTFPVLLAGTREECEATQARRVTLARELTGRDPVEMPEPEVLAHGGEYRYDLVLLKPETSGTRWQGAYFPMVHVNTGPACNIRCVYCNVHGGDDQRLFDRDYVQQMIDAAFAWCQRELPGLRPTLDFIGGEPTLHPDLPALVAYARKIGFPSVLICSNGVLLKKAGFLDKLAAAGLSGVRYSLHDHRAEMAGRLADIPGVGSRYPEVARLLLSRRDLVPHIFRLLLPQTLDALDEYMRWVGEHNHTGKRLQITLGMPSARGRMQSTRELYPPLSELRERVRSAIRIGESFGLDVIVHHAPACVHPEDTTRAMCLHVEALQVDALLGERRAFNTEGDAEYGAACDRCPARSAGCYGLPRAYFELDREGAEAWLTPVSLPE